MTLSHPPDLNATVFHLFAPCTSIYSASFLSSSDVHAPLFITFLLDPSLMLLGAIIERVKGVSGGVIVKRCGCSLLLRL